MKGRIATTRSPSKATMCTRWPRRRRCAPRYSPSFPKPRTTKRTRRVPSERAIAAFSRKEVSDAFEEYQKRIAGRFAEQEKLRPKTQLPRKGKKTQDTADKKSCRFQLPPGSNSPWQLKTADFLMQRIRTERDFVNGTSDI